MYSYVFACAACLVWEFPLIFSFIKYKVNLVISVHLAVSYYGLKIDRRKLFMKCSGIEKMPFLIDICADVTFAVIWRTIQFR